MNKNMNNCCCCSCNNNSWGGHQNEEEKWVCHCEKYCEKEKEFPNCGCTHKKENYGCDYSKGGYSNKYSEYDYGTSSCGCGNKSSNNYGYNSSSFGWY